MRNRLAGVIVAACVIALLTYATWAQPARRPRPGGGVETPVVKPLPKNDIEKKILAVLDDMDKNQRRGMMNVPTQDGRLLRMLTEMSGAKLVVEIGTSSGYSGIWISLGLLKTGGKLITHDIDARRAGIARANFKRAGVESVVTLVEGDAHKTVSKIKGPIDIIFLDADRQGYVDYLKKLLPKLRPGGLIVTHNARSYGSSMKPYFEAVSGDANLETLFLNMHAAGLGVTMKKR
jgi:caffeoyl-CoA O-methyltransferase